MFIISLLNSWLISHPYLFQEQLRFFYINLCKYLLSAKPVWVVTGKTTYVVRLDVSVCTRVWVVTGWLYVYTLLGTVGWLRVHVPPSGDRTVSRKRLSEVVWQQRRPDPLGPGWSRRPRIGVPSSLFSTSGPGSGSPILIRQVFTTRFGTEVLS